jgi:subtilisin family serine protease
MRTVQDNRPVQRWLTFLPFLVLLLFAIGLPASAAGGGSEARLDPTLRFMLRGGRLPGLVPTRSIAGMETVDVIIQAEEDISPQLRRLGARVRSVIGTDPVIITADVPLRALRATANIRSVLSLRASRPIHHTLNASIPEIHADQVWATTHNGMPVKGRGVVVAVVDSGIDWQHGDFKDAQGHSRILKIWDQTAKSGTPPAGYDYGNLCTRDQINGGQCPETDGEGHGTHVSSIAAGNGLSTDPARYVGVAPESDLLMVKDAGRDANVLDAWNYIVRQARALGKPVVINNSFGSHGGAHDGTDELEKAIDQLSGSGVVFVVAAGNEATDAIHAAGTIGPGETVNTTYTFPEPSPLNVSEADIWYNQADAISTAVIAPGGQTFGPVHKGEMQHFSGPDNTTITIDAGPWAGNPDNWVWIQVQKPDGEHVSGNWAFTLHGDSITAGGHWDAWLATGQGAGSGTEYFTANVDSHITVGEPATARKAVTVASYTTKACWPSLEGDKCYDPEPTLGAISDFSSIGPTRDGRQKPDLAAPGEAITAALSRDARSEFSSARVDPDNKHLSIQGTSMAAPHVAGAIALMLQVNPTLNATAALDILRRTARTDSFTGSVWNAAWGTGKLDAKAAVEAARAVPAGARVYLPAVARNYAAVKQPTPTATPTVAGPMPTPSPTLPAPTPTPPGETCEEYIVNGGFEEGADGFAGWNLSENVQLSDHAYEGGYSAWLGGYNNAEDWLGQADVHFPANVTAARLTFFADLTTNEDPNVNVAYDDFCVGIWPIGTPSGNALISMGCLTNLNATDGWAALSYDFTPEDLNLVDNQTRSLWFRVRTDDEFPTSVYLDGVSLEVCATGE